MLRDVSYEQPEEYMSEIWNNNVDLELKENVEKLWNNNVDIELKEKI